MQFTICPFFGRNAQQCAVGCGEVSTQDRTTIETFCSGPYPECGRYLRLAREQLAMDFLSSSVHSPGQGIFNGVGKALCKAVGITENGERLKA